MFQEVRNIAFHPPVSTEGRVAQLAEQVTLIIRL